MEIFNSDEINTIHFNEFMNEFVETFPMAQMSLNCARE